MTTTKIHWYLSQAMFTTSKTLYNYSTFCKHLDTLFVTVNVRKNGEKWRWILPQRR